MAALPLAGLLVPDLIVHCAGPTAVPQLADWGADVIKIQPPGRGCGNDSARRSSRRRLWPTLITQTSGLRPRPVPLTLSKNAVAGCTAAARSEARFKSPPARGHFYLAVTCKLDVGAAAHDRGFELVANLFQFTILCAILSFRILSELALPSS